MPKSYQQIANKRYPSLLFFYVFFLYMFMFFCICNFVYVSIYHKSQAHLYMYKKLHIRKWKEKKVDFSIISQPNIMIIGLRVYFLICSVSNPER